MCRIWIMYLQPTEFKIENVFKLMTIWFTLYICISRFDILFAAVSSATNSRVEAKPSNTGDVSCFVTPFSYALHVVVKKIYICMIMFKISTAHSNWKKRIYTYLEVLITLQKQKIYPKTSFSLKGYNRICVIRRIEKNIPSKIYAYSKTTKYLRQQNIYDDLAIC